MTDLQKQQPSSRAAERLSPKLKTYIDLFCGIGGFHVAANNLGMECLFACDIDEEARKAYQHNFGLYPHGDITSLATKNIPDHDVLCAGFPCQPFSIIGSRKGFSDPRGTLFFEIARIIRDKKPKAVVLENVRQLASINGGKTLENIKDTLEQLGYYVDSRILNALNFGVPQKRERILIIATRRDIGQFPWPEKKIPMKPLKDILEKKPDPKYLFPAKSKGRAWRRISRKSRRRYGMKIRAATYPAIPFRAPYAPEPPTTTFWLMANGA